MFATASIPANIARASISPEITGYSSDGQISDDIRYLDHDGKAVVLPEDKVSNLDADGSIYIHFDRTIRQDTLSAFPSLMAATHMYKIPEAKEILIDGNGKVQDSKLSFIPYAYTNSYGSTEETIIPEDVFSPDFILDDIEIRSLQEIEVGTAEIINSNVLRITPKHVLDNLTKYKIIVDKSVIEDNNGINIDRDIDFTFWTKSENLSSSAVWKAIEGIPEENIKENTELPYKSYSIYDAPSYSDVNPIVINLDGQVIVKPGDEIIKQTPNDAVNERRITFDAISEIKLENVYNSVPVEKNIKLQKYEIQYLYEAGSIKTRLSIYPEDALGFGTSYKLSIPEGVFVTRSGNKAPRLEVNFVTISDPTEMFGIYQIDNNTAVVSDIWQKGEWAFKLRGYNFYESNVAMIKLYDSVKNRSITISKDDIEFVSLTELNVKIRGSNMENLSQEGYTGKYEVRVYYTASSFISDNIMFELLSKGRPKVKEKFPYPIESNKWIDEKSLVHDVQDSVTTGKHFLKITYEDIDGKLTFDRSLGLSLLRDASTVYGQGSNNSMIDSEFISTIMNAEESIRNGMIDKYIFTKNRTKREAYLFIPIRPLQASLAYDASISPAVVFNDASVGSSDSIIWRFSTMYKPLVIGINLASVSEEYDSSQKIEITGSHFYGPTVKVYFNNVEARAVNFLTDENGKQYLEVFLPVDDNRLKPGIYTVTVSNDTNHERISYGSLSVVKRGIYIPDNDIGYKGRSEFGTIKYDYKVSEDILELNILSSGTGLITMNLDDIMGTDVWTRKIKYYNTNQWVTLEKLQTLSKWANITFYDLSFKPNTEGIVSTLKLGRVEAVQAQTLKSKLDGKKLKSEMIQVSGEDFYANQIDMVIPFKNSNGSSLKIMKYDEASRSWIRQEGTIDRIEKVVRFTTYKTGIFVVVE
jgi:hypothetical protein